MAAVSLPLEEMTLLYGTTYSGGKIQPSAGWADFIHPDWVPDRATTYTVTVDYEMLVAGAPQLYVMGSTPEGSGFVMYGDTTGPGAVVGATGTLSLTIGPGLGGWDTATVTHVLFEVGQDVAVTAASYDGGGVVEPPPEPSPVSRYRRGPRIYPLKSQQWTPRRGPGSYY